MTEKFNAKNIWDAYERIKDFIYKTPLEPSLYLGQGERQYFFKLESSQSVKSFKIRGALSKMTTLTQQEKKRGVATISSGNHGISVSYGAKLLGIEEAKVIVPKNTPKSKVDRIKHYGAEVMLLGNCYDEAHSEGMAFINEMGMTYIDAYYDDPMIYAGQGTIAIEILSQDPEIDTIVVPIGGGGLITGIAVAAKSIKPEVKIIGVQTEACPAMIRALAEQKFYEEYPITGETVCDALVGGVGKLSYEILGQYVDDIIEVKESEIRDAMRFMIRKEKFIAEGGSCTTVAAARNYSDRIGGKKIALVISGGNLDDKLMMQILNEKEI